MEDPTSKRIASTGSAAGAGAGTGAGAGGGGDKPPFKLNPAAKAFTPAPPKPQEQYTREFETVAQQQFNALFVPLGVPRARSLSVGIYDPNTDQRTNRAHYHLDPMRPDAGQPIAKPDAAGRYGGVFSQYTATPLKK